MDLNRIKQILSSPDDIPVHYHGVPVWIDSVDATASMATVHARDSHDEKRLVSIDELNEKNRRESAE